MKYCVVKNTTTIIDGSQNPNEVMLKNAINAGFTSADVEILTAEEYEARVSTTPVPPRPKTEMELVQEENAQQNLTMIQLFEAIIPLIP